MALLDELKQQARDAEARREEERRSAASEASMFRKRAQPAMLRAYHYLREFVDNLVKADPDIFSDYEVEGAGRLERLRQHDYMLKADDVPDTNDLTLSYVCSRDETVTFRVFTRDGVKREREYLWKHGMLFNFREDVGAAGSAYCGSFEMEAHVRVSVHFEIAAQEQRIRITTKNLNHIGADVYQVKVEDFTESFLEELAKSVLHQPNTFDELMGFKVGDDVRTQLRERLQREAEAKARELGERPARRKRSKAIAADGDTAGAGPKKKGFLRSLFD
ncbi:MAG: hypothetical protein U5S82_09745 [Gammaproteobacteria bacterium]|nr:hypothetical protein [Gammaproteobacteria bacterium]